MAEKRPCSRRSTRPCNLPDAGRGPSAPRGRGAARLERTRHGRCPPGREDVGGSRRLRRRRAPAHRARRRFARGSPVSAGAATTLARLPGINAERAEALALRAVRRGTVVMTPGDPDFPIADDVPHVPAVLFLEGQRPEVLRAPRVAVVGTRAASVHGLTDAWELGAFLGAAGITVVSGLAIGIDGAAHHGAIQAAEAAEQRGEPS